MNYLKNLGKILKFSNIYTTKYKKPKQNKIEKFFVLSGMILDSIFWK